jgi:multimeric flavodoxin WrbA
MKKKGDSGLSNSEVLLAAGLWAAHKEGAEIDRLSLAEHFTASGQQRHPEVLREKLLEADGLLISGPIYFGDRGSLAESLIEFIATDKELKEAMRGRVYAGLSVGSKRNGGQETTLIYQMFDMVNLGLLAVGNDSDSTAQYGGTGMAGDVGTVHKDSYGIDTSLGTGRRIARVLRLMRSESTLQDKSRTLFLVLHDSKRIGERMVNWLATRYELEMHSTVVNLTSKHIKRCMACDICPSHVGQDEEYRCVINSLNDHMRDLHKKLLYHDLIVPVYVSSHDSVAGSNYQSFIERTRYLRRSDYIWNDIMVAPLVLEEPGGYRLLPIRMLTSFVRHQSIMAKPMIGYLDNEEVTNRQHIEKDFSRTLSLTRTLAAGRLVLGQETAVSRRYNQIGYVLSADKDQEDERMQRRREAGEARRNRLIKDAERRLGPSANA